MKRTLLTILFASLALVQGAPSSMASADEDTVVYTLTLGTEVPEQGQFTVELGMEEDDSELLLTQKQRSRRVSEMMKAQETRTFLRVGPAGEKEMPESEGSSRSIAESNTLPPVPAGIPSIPAATEDAGKDSSEGLPAGDTATPFQYPDRPFGTLTDAARAGIDPFAEKGSPSESAQAPEEHGAESANEPELAPSTELDPPELDTLNQITLTSQTPAEEPPELFDWKNVTAYKNAFQDFFSEFEMRVGGILAIGVILAWFFSRTKRSG